MSGRMWAVAGAVAGFVILVAVGRSCINVNRVHTPGSWIEVYANAEEDPTLGRNFFFSRLSRFDRAEAASALVAAIGRDEEAYRKKRFGFILSLARLAEPSALAELLALHRKLEGSDRGLLLFAIGSSLTEENVKELLAACEKDAALLEGLPQITGEEEEEERLLDEWKDYFKESGAVEEVRSYCRDRAERLAGSR